MSRHLARPRWNLELPESRRRPDEVRRSPTEPCCRCMPHLRSSWPLGCRVSDVESEFESDVESEVKSVVKTEVESEVETNPGF